MVTITKHKIIAGTQEEFKELQEAYIFLRQNFILSPNKDNSTLFVKSTTPNPRTIENKFKNFGKDVLGIEIYPGKEEMIKGVFNISDQTENYSLFWFNSQKEGLTIGMEEKDNKKYLFEINYNPEE